MFRLNLVSKALWTLEEKQFYPKWLKVLHQYNVLQTSEKKDLTVFDVGANLGQTILFYKKNFENIKIFAFEPHPECFSFLEMNFSGKAEVYNFALSNFEGISPFYISPFAETSTLKLPNYSSKWFHIKNLILGLDKKNAYTKIDVQTSTVDSFIEKNQLLEIDLLKVDVEGAELQVLQGCLDAFSKKIVKSIQIEIHHNDLRDDIGQEINNLLIQNSFVRVASVRHSFGNFTDDLYLLV
jgi:FkbM family methyltransferase